MIKQLLQIRDELIIAKWSIDEQLRVWSIGLGETKVLGVHMNSSLIILGIGHGNLYYENSALFLYIGSFFGYFLMASYLLEIVNVILRIRYVFCARTKMNPCIICSFNVRFLCMCGTTRRSGWV